MLFLGRYIPSITPLVGCLVFWLGGSGDDVVVNDSYHIFNLDCRVSVRSNLRVSGFSFEIPWEYFDQAQAYMLTLIYLS